MQPPFPESGEEILEVALLSFHFIGLMFFIVLMIYCVRVIKDILPIIVVYAFSIFIAFDSLNHAHPPISPMIEIFFVIFQTALFIMSAIETFETRKSRLNR